MIRTIATRTDDFNYAIDEPRKCGAVTSESLAEQTAAFLAAGGKIQQVGIGVSGETAKARRQLVLTPVRRRARDTLGKGKRPQEDA